MSKQQSDCPFDNCSATRPTIIDYDFDNLPKNVQDELIKQELHPGPLSKCLYCGNIWTRNAYNSLITVGIDNLGKGMIWKILE